MITFDESVLYKFLKYVFLTIFIYLILRYTPYIKLEQNKALTITIILMIVYIVLEILYYQVYLKLFGILSGNKSFQETFSEKFENNGNCKSCKEDEPEKNDDDSQTKCKLVCNKEPTVNKKKSIVEIDQEEEQRQNCGFKNMVYDEYPSFNDNKFANDIMKSYENLNEEQNYNEQEEEEQNKNPSLNKKIIDELNDKLPCDNYNKLPKGYINQAYEYAFISSKK